MDEQLKYWFYKEVLWDMCLYDVACPNWRHDTTVMKHREHAHNSPSVFRYIFPLS